MFTLTIKKNDTITHGPSQFASEAELQSHLQYHKDMNTYGVNESSYEQLISEEVPAVFDEEGNELSPAIPAVYETIHVPADYTVEIVDITAQMELEQAKQLKIEAGKKARETCQKVLDLISGENLDKELTLEQISDMQTVFSGIETALMSARPTFAKMMINAVEPDGILVTAELKQACLELLADY